jgi:biopolymer transport protein ExbB/TolQ
MLDTLAMIAALVAVFGVVAAKAVVTVRMRLLRRQLARADHEKEKLQHQLRSLLAQRKVSDAGKTTVASKHKKLEKRRQALEKELAELGADEERRELQRERARGHMIRGPKAAADENDDDDA